MSVTVNSLMTVYEGWDGYQQSLVNAVAPLTSAQLSWRPSPQHRSVGELVRHISMGRLTWFVRMGAPHSAKLASQIADWQQDSDGNQDIIEEALPIAEDTAALSHWLEATWQMIEAMLANWTVADLSQTYRHTWNGDVYDVSYQWTIWRIMAHDIHHGGELSLMLGLQGIEAFELSALGGHIVLPALAGLSD